MIHLHVHSKYSLLDAIIEPKDLVEKAKEDGSGAVCFTDHGNIMASVETYKLCKENDVKFILGCEFYICNDVEVKDTKDKYNHLVVWAKNEEGRKNINRLVSLSTQYKYYGKPRIDWEMLKEHKEGLIVASACMAGEISRILMGRKTQDQILEEDIAYRQTESGKFPVKMSKKEMAMAVASRYKQEFGEDYYIEIQAHDNEEQLKLNEKLVEIANKLDIEIVVTTDAHYLTEDEQKYHDIWVQIGTTREAGEVYDDCFIMNEQAVRNIISKTLSPIDVERAISNTRTIANKCNTSMPLKDPQLPHMDIPKEFGGEMEYIQYLCAKGWVDKGIVSKPKNEQEEYKKRLHYELDVLDKMGYMGYFIIVHGYKAQAYEVGIARGCTVGETMIFTQNGLKPIKDIEIGDMVYTHDGTVHPVTNTMKYDTMQDEKLYKIRTNFSDNIGHAYTDNHKILAIKPERCDIGGRQPNKVKKYKSPTQGEPQWYRADEIEVGDMLVVPKFKTKPNFPHQIDLAKYAKKDKNTSVGERTIVEYVNTNKPFKFSVRDIHNNTGLSRSCISNVLNKGKYKQKSESKIMDYVGESFASIEEWREYVSIHRYCKREYNRFVSINEESLRLLGLMTGDGWVRSDKKRDDIGLCWHSEEKNKDEYPILIKDVFGEDIDILLSKHKSKKLVQATFESHAIKGFLTDFWSGYEHTSSTKNFPDWVLTLPDNLKLAFLSGLWEADGSSKRSTVTFASTSWALISKVKILLNSLNIPNGMHKRDMLGSERDSQSWTVSAYNNSSTTSVEIREDIHLKRVTSVDLVEDSFVYDITVANNHTYVTSSYVAHNSAGGSLVAYLTNITDIDPIAHGLYFERFLDVSALKLIEDGVITKSELKIPDYLYLY